MATSGSTVLTQKDLDTSKALNTSDEKPLTQTTTEQGTTMATSVFTALTQKELDMFKALNISDEQLQAMDTMKKTAFDNDIKRYTHINDDAGQDKTTNVGKPESLRLVLLGKTGAGKSATGNLIIGGGFEESASSVSCTKTNLKGTAKVDGIDIQLIDTPGICDTELGDDAILTEIARIFNDFSDGIHAFLFVYNLGNVRFTQEEMNACETMNEAFGGTAFYDHCFMILTRGDTMKKEMSLKTKLEEEKDNAFGILIIENMKKKVIVVDNATDTPYFRNQLQKEIVRLVANQVTEPFTNDSILQYLEHKKSTQHALPVEDQKHAPDVENAVAATIKEIGRDAIEKLTLNCAPDGKIEMDDKTQKIVEEISKSLKKEGITVQEKSIVTVTKAQQERLTNDSFLGKISAVWGKFLGIFRGK